MYERYGQRSLRSLWSVSHLADKKIVTCQEGTLHGRRWNLERLEEEDVYERHHYGSEQYGIYPAEQTVRRDPFTEFAGNAELVDDRNTEQPPPVAVPDNP